MEYLLIVNTGCDEYNIVHRTEDIQTIKDGYLAMLNQYSKHEIMVFKATELELTPNVEITEKKTTKKEDTLWNTQ